MPAGLNGRRALVRFLQRIGTITLADAPDLEAASGDDFTALLERASGIDAASLAERLVAELRLERFVAAGVDPSVATVLAQELAERHDVVVVRMDDHSVHVAMVNPLDLDAIKDVEFATRRRAHALVATPDDIRSALEWVYAGGPPPPEPPPPEDPVAAPPFQPVAPEPVAPPPADPLATVMPLIHACRVRLAVLEEERYRTPPTDPSLIARVAALEAVIAELQVTQQAAEEAHRDDVARLSAEQDALVAAQGAGQRDVVDAAVRRTGEMLLPRFDELAAGTLAAADRADGAQRSVDALAGLLEDVRVAPHETPNEVPPEVADRLDRLDDGLTTQRVELTKLAQQTEAFMRRTDGWASSSEVRSLEAEQMALAAQLHRAAQGVEWARAGLAETRGEVGRARELAEGARRVAEASVPAGALEAVRDALDARLRQVATQVMRYEAGLGRLSGAQGDLEEALTRVRAIAEETRRLTGMMATVERASALDASIAALRGEVARIASIVDAPEPSLFATACAWGARGVGTLWSLVGWMMPFGRA
ncbi:MAG TPA: hypothetical protein VGR62_02370 [Candidatus Binatia bacterium]|jgi:hypothetical protein|nr:hypothetical protein [Candidatus Binatia bacterium]